MNRLAVAILTILMTFTTAETGGGSEEPPISLSVSPTYQNEPLPGHDKAVVTFKITVPAHRDNVMICFGWHNPRYVITRTSCQEHNGQYAPRTTWQEYKVYPGNGQIGFAAIYRAPFRLVDMISKPFSVIPDE